MHKRDVKTKIPIRHWRWALASPVVKSFSIIWNEKYSYTTLVKSWDTFWTRKGKPSFCMEYFSSQNFLLKYSQLLIRSYLMCIVSKKMNSRFRREGTWQNYMNIIYLRTTDDTTVWKKSKINIRIIIIK